VRGIEVGPPVRRGDRFPRWRGRRALVGRLAALAVVSAVLLLPQTSSARTTPLVPAPGVAYTIDGIDGANGWYRGSTQGNYVVLHWIVTGQVNSAPCEYAIQIAGPNKGTTRTCTATGPGGTTTVTTTSIKIDATPPSVAGKVARNPDANGWFNHAVPVAFYGGDPTSGLASCSSATYKGPDSAQAVVHGTCTDKAGNVGSGSVTFAYDATPPQLKKLTMKRLSRAIQFRWQVSPDTKRVLITRAPGAKPGTSANVYGGMAKSFKDKGLKIGKRYRYTVSAYDVAGNKASRTVAVTATGALVAPAPGARVKGSPRLQWAPVAGASYYNVQLVRGGTIFSAWPKGTSLRLPRSWVYHGHRYRLHRGVYRWFVWPGFGTLSANRYGRLIGKSSFFFGG
jgi:hypothetical protein